jgi:hypothetical protein
MKKSKTLKLLFQKGQNLHTSSASTPQIHHSHFKLQVFYDILDLMTVIYDSHSNKCSGSCSEKMNMKFGTSCRTCS